MEELKLKSYEKFIGLDVGDVIRDDKGLKLLQVIQETALYRTCPISFDYTKRQFKLVSKIRTCNICHYLVRGIRYRGECALYYKQFDKKKK